MNLEQALSGKVQTVINALNVAAKQYEQDADECADTPRIAQQFERQAAEARALVETLESL